MTLKQYIILRELNKVDKCNNPFNSIKLMNSAKVGTNCKMYALMQDLKDKGYIQTFTADNQKVITSAELSYMGFRFKQIILLKIIKTALTWFFDNLVGIAAFLIALKALLLEL